MAAVLKSHRRQVIGGLLALAGFCVVISPARNALADLAAQPTLPPPLQVVASPNDPAGETTDSGTTTDLSASDRVTAVQIVNQDPALQRLLAGSSYTFEDIGPWTTQQTQTLLGAAVLLHLDKPSTISGTWPSAVYDVTEKTNPPYAAKSASYAATAVNELMVEIALPQKSIVDVSPTGFTSVIPGPGYASVFGSSSAQPASGSQP